MLQKFHFIFKFNDNSNHITPGHGMTSKCLPLISLTSADSLIDNIWSFSSWEIDSEKSEASLDTAESNSKSSKEQFIAPGFKKDVVVHVPYFYVFLDLISRLFH